jgi:predicted CXXCH cytochrome family protein
VEFRSAERGRKAGKGSVDLRTFAIVAAGCTCIVTNACAGTAPPSRTRPPVSSPLPEIKKDCATCHLPTGTAKAGELKKKLSALCLDCHPDRKAPADHKVDFVPPGDIKGLPLTDGMITCSTCHDPHKNPHGNLLRMKATDLCLTCHPV